MRGSWPFFQPFFSLLAFAGCASPDAPSAGSAAGSLVVANGIHLNGLHLNGLHLNGLHLNGPTLDDTTLDDLRLDHLLLDDRPLNGVTLDAGALVARGLDLTGARVSAALSDGSPVTLRIDAIAPGFPAPRYTVSIAGDGLPFHPLCGLAGGAPVMAFALAGGWDESEGTPDGGSHRADPLRFTFACEGHALAKCVALGYTPWGSAPECRGPGDCHALPLAALHQACTRLLRADYCGDGTSATRDGTTVDLWDAASIEQDTAPSWPFEAEWSEGGATCVAATRHLTLPDGGLVRDYIQAHCPARWQPQSCGGAGSTFFPAAGFTRSPSARALLRSRLDPAP